MVIYGTRRDGFGEGVRRDFGLTDASTTRGRIVFSGLTCVVNGAWFIESLGDLFLVVRVNR